MLRIFHLILACVFIVAGASPVPACYATRPNCELKTKSGCPLLGSNSMAITADTVPCCHAAKSTQEPEDRVPFPPERLKRLTLDQINQTPFDIPHFVPAWIIRIIYWQAIDTASYQNARWRFNDHFHPPPPALFLQHQSFLI